MSHLIAAAKKGSEYIAVFVALFGALYWALGDNVDSYISEVVAKDGYLTLQEADKRALVRTAQIEVLQKDLNAIKGEVAETGRQVDTIQLDAASTKGIVNHLDQQTNRVEDKIDQLLLQLQRQ